MKSLLTAFLVLMSATVLADRGEQKQLFGDYEVHYIGLNSSFLTPAVAEAYGVPRSRQLGFISISILKKDDQYDELPTPVAGTVTGTIKNLIGQSREIEFKEIRETSAVYYISTFRFDNKDLYQVSLQVKPEDSNRTLDVNFDQRFYEEP